MTQFHNHLYANDLDKFLDRYGFKVEGGYYMTNTPMASGWICARDDLIRMVNDVVREAVAAERASCRQEYKFKND